jgi:hypothetical protein
MMDKSNGITREKPVSNITNKITGVATQKVKSVSRLPTPYKGGDTLMDWHRAKAKSSLSEAYRDADYATAGWKTNSEWDDFVQFSKDCLIAIPLIGVCLYIVYEIFVYLDILVVRL